MMPDRDKFGDQLIMRDYLAVDRTRLANERTFLSYVRTGIGVLAAGIGLIKLIDDQLLNIAGYILLVIFVVLIAIGLYRYVQTMRQINRAEAHWDEEAKSMALKR